MINRLIVQLITILPEKLIWLFSKKYIAGKSLKNALPIVKEFNKNKISTTLDILGESVHNRHEALAFQKLYFEAIEQCQTNQLQTTFSLKPTMFGLLYDQNDCYILIREIVQLGNKYKLGIAIDMEDSTCTEAELELFVKLYSEFPETVSIVLQAYLKRTYTDLQMLKRRMDSKYPINVRLCKGIYVEPFEIAYKERNQINENYINCLDFLFSNNFYPAIATHDKLLINKAFDMILKYKTPKNCYEFQMLYGVTPNLRHDIIIRNHNMRIYVPYGEHWLRYSTRRLKENPQLIYDVITSLFRRK